MARVAIALGSNLGNRRAQLESAIDLVLPHVRSALVSSVIETDAVGVGDQPSFLNAASSVKRACRRLRCWRG